MPFGLHIRSLFGNCYNSHLKSSCPLFLVLGIKPRVSLLLATQIISEVYIYPADWKSLLVVSKSQNTLLPTMIKKLLIFIRITGKRCIETMVLDCLPSSALCLYVMKELHGILKYRHSNFCFIAMFTTTTDSKAVVTKLLLLFTL